MLVAAYMYATLSYDVNAGPEPIEDVRAALLELFAERTSCDMLSDTFICTVDNTEDYLEMAKKLNQIGVDFPGQFLYVFTLHRARDPLRSNGFYPKPKAKEILES
jgi:hypothetical protein